MSKDGGNMRTYGRSKNHEVYFLKAIPAIIAACFGCSSAVANPTGAQVMSGQATIANQGNIISITNSPGTIINWKNFSINAGETARFIQLNSTSSVLNRVVGQDPSNIFGALQSNGRVFLLNSNGILFGREAKIDVHGLIASTLALSDNDFLQGKLKFKEIVSAKSIANQGMISTPVGGRIYLIASNVENSGILTSPKGEIILAAGHSVQLVDSANPDLRVVISANENQALNVGEIIAQSGKVGIYGGLINQRGVVSANSAVVDAQGKITFKATRDVILGADSQTSATAVGSGGTIHVLGDRVGVTDDAKIDASGNTGGGTVLVGGDYRGQNQDIQRAQRTYFGKNAEIKANALVSGDGGKIILWADDATRAYGKIFARSGPTSGNGGLVETSGKKSLDFHGKVDLRAPHGRAGNLLLDPNNITIQTSGMSDVVLSGGVFDAGPAAAVLTVSDLEAQLGLGNVTISTSAGTGGIDNGKITVADPVNWSANALKLEADNGIAINAAMTGGIGSSLALRANAGDITQTAPISAPTLSAHAVMGSVVLTHANNQVGTLDGWAGDASGSGFSFVNSTPLNLNPLSSPSKISITTTGVGNMLTVPGTTTLSGESIFLAADRMNLQSGAVIKSGTGVLWIKPMSPGRNIDLGSTTDASANTLELSANELNTFSGSGLLRIGSPDTGDLNISAAIAPAFTGPLSLHSSGNIMQDVSASITANDLAIRAAGSAMLNTAVNMVSNLAAKCGDATHHINNFSFKNGRALNIVNNIDGVSGITMMLDSSGYDPANPNGVIALQAQGGALSQSRGALLAGKAVYAEGASVMMNEPNPTGVLAGQATGSSAGDVFQYASNNAIWVTAVNGFSGIRHLGAMPGSMSIQLASGGTGIFQDSTAPIVSSGGLNLVTSGVVSLKNAENNVGAISAAGVAGLYFYNAGPLTLGINNVDITTTDQPIEIMASGTLTVKNDVRSNNAGIWLDAPNIQIGSTSGVAIQGGEVRIHANQPDTGTISTAGTASTITSDNDISLEADNLNFSAAPPTFNGREINYATISDNRTIHTSTITNAIYNTQYLIIGNEIAADLNTAGDILVDAIIDRPGLGMALLSGGAVRQNAPIITQNLAVRAGTVSGVAGSVVLNAANQIGNLSVETQGGAILFNNAGTINIETLTDGKNTATGIRANDGDVSITATSGDIIISAPIIAGGGTVELNTTKGAIIQIDGIINAASLKMATRDGIGSGNPLITQVGSLTANNLGLDSNIDIDNSGPLMLFDVTQNNLGSGSITINNKGPIIVAANSIISTGTGNINLLAHSPLTVDGIINSGSGVITLEAGASGNVDDVLTISATGEVATSGSIFLRAGEAINVFGKLSGDLIQEPYLNGSLPPVIDPCFINPSLANCTTDADQPINDAINSTLTALNQGKTLTNTTAPTTVAAPLENNSTPESSSKGTEQSPENKKEEKKEVAESSDKNTASKKNEVNGKMSCN